MANRWPRKRTCSCRPTWKITLEFSFRTFFYAEFANVFWKAERQARITTRLVEAALESVLNVPLEVTPTLEVVREASGAKDRSVIARKYDRTVYDSIYMALAVRTGHHLITADNRLVSAVGDLLPVFWLGSL